MTEQVKRAIDVSKRLLERHEEGPIGRLNVHRMAREFWSKCPICGERLLKEGPS